MREINKRVKVIHKTLGLLDGVALASEKGRYLVRVGAFRPTWIDKRYVSEADSEADGMGDTPADHHERAL